MQRGRKIYQGNWLMCLWKPANQYRDFPASSWRTKKASFVIYSESEASELRASDRSPNPKAHVPGALKSRGRRRWMMLQLRQGESECSFLYRLFHSDTQWIDSCPFTLGTDLLRSPKRYKTLGPSESQSSHSDPEIFILEFLQCQGIMAKLKNISSYFICLCLKYKIYK